MFAYLQKKDDSQIKFGSDIYVTNLISDNRGRIEPIDKSKRVLTNTRIARLALNAFMPLSVEHLQNLSSQYSNLCKTWEPPKEPLSRIFMKGYDRYRIEHLRSEILNNYGVKATAPVILKLALLALLNTKEDGINNILEILDSPDVQQYTA